MNPLGLEPSRFTIACVDAPSGSIAAVVQTVRMGAAGTEGGAAGSGLGSDAGPGPGAVKLQSLVVAPEHRDKGLGSALVRHRLSSLPPGTPVWLTAVERGVAFYSRLGFRLRGLTEVPSELWFEVAAGTLVARLAVNQQLVVMSTVTPANKTI